MHVLICAPRAEPARTDEPSGSAGTGERAEPERAEAGASSGPGARTRAGALAAAWSGAAPHCTVEPLELDTPAPADRASSGLPPAEPQGVFVPVTSLGLGSTREHVPPHVARLRERVRGADLAVVHVEVLDGAALRAGPVAAVAGAAAPYAVPVVVVADDVAVTRREWSAAGVSGVHELAGAGPDGAGRAAEVRDRGLSRVARTWTPVWSVSSR